MSKDLSRRQILQTSLGAAALAGLGLAGMAHGTPAAAAPADRPRQEFPDVPGMLGDRRANEFWYQFDEAFLYKKSRELQDAFNAIFAVTGGVGESDLYQVWLHRVGKPDYPHNFTAIMAPVREPLQVVSRLQLAVFDSFYWRHDPRLITAFADFAQGVLYDPRRLAVQEPVHTMNGDPPVGYHVWHVLLRAMMFLGIDRQRWGEMDPRIGFGWAVQTVAHPDEYAVNPPLPHRTVRRLAASWLSRTPERLDIDFQSFPYPPGVG
jgi:hypothetical protein